MFDPSCDKPVISASTPGKRHRDREQTPAQRALGLLVRREHSRKELARKLAARGIDEQDAAAAVARMAAEGWQDDARFAASLARSRAAGGYGPLRIRAELGAHGLDGEAVDHALQALAEAGADDWAGRARDLVSRRYGECGMEDVSLRRKAAHFLARRGFDAASIRAATREDLPDS